MIKLKVTKVTKENFKNFGQFMYIPAEGEFIPTNQAAFFKFYGGMGLMDCHGITELGICTFKKRPLETSELEQHAGTPELLYALDGDFMMPIAPIIYQNGASCPDVSRAMAIRVNQYEGVIFNDGIWHWAPFPLQETSSVIVGFKKDTALTDILIKDIGDKIVMEV